MKNNNLQLSHEIKNICQSKLYQRHTHLRKTFIQLLLLKICETFLFRQSKNVCSTLWFVLASFGFLEKRRPNRYCLWKKKISFPHVHIYFDLLNCKLILKNRSKECWLCVDLFLWRTKN